MSKRTEYYILALGFFFSFVAFTVFTVLLFDKYCSFDTELSTRDSFLMICGGFFVASGTILSESIRHLWKGIRCKAEEGVDQHEA